MSVIIRLQNLPWTASALDIRSYFEGLSIPEGGVRILGGEIGDAFILFSSDEDARLAMLKDRGMLAGVQIRLYLSSRTEMVKVFEDMRSARITKAPTTHKEDNIDFEEYKIQARVTEEHIPGLEPCTVTPNFSKKTSTVSKQCEVPKNKSMSKTLNKYELSLLIDIDHSDQGSAEYSPMKSSISYAEYKKRSRDRSRSPRAHHDSDCRDKFASREHERESNNAHALARENHTKNEKSSVEKMEINDVKKSTATADDLLSKSLKELTNSNWLLTFMQNMAKNKNTPTISTGSNAGNEQRSISPVHKQNSPTVTSNFSNLGQSNNMVSLPKDQSISNDLSNGLQQISSSDDDDDDCIIVNSMSAINKSYKAKTINSISNKTPDSMPLTKDKSRETSSQIFNVPPPTTFLTSMLSSMTALPTDINTKIPPPKIQTYSTPNNMITHHNNVTNIKNSNVNDKINNTNNNFNNNIDKNVNMNNNNINNKFHNINNNYNAHSKISPHEPSASLNTPLLQHYSAPSGTVNIIDNMTHCIEMALATPATDQDIRHIFYDMSIPMDGIVIEPNNQRHDGISKSDVVCHAYVKFTTSVNAQRALLKNCQIYNNHRVFIRLIKEEKFHEMAMNKTTRSNTKLAPIVVNKPQPQQYDRQPQKKKDELNVLCVENLTTLTQKGNIKAMFAAYGDYDVIMAEQFGNRMGFWAFLKFNTESAAMAALADRNAHQLNGQFVKVRASSVDEAIASKKAELLAHEQLTRDQQALLNGTDSSSIAISTPATYIDNNSHKKIVNNINNKDFNKTTEDRSKNFIILKNVAFTTTKNDVERMLNIAGLPPSKVELLYDHSKRPKGELIVEFGDAETAKSAIKDLHNKPFRGRTVRVYPISQQKVADLMQKPCYNYFPHINTKDS